MAVDWEAHANEGPGQDALARLASLADKQVELQAELDDLARQAKDVGKRLAHLTDETIPGVLDECGLSEGKFRLPNGRVVEVSEVLRPPSMGARSEYKPRMVAWLEGRGDGDLVKDTVAAQFGRGETERAAKLVALVESEYTAAVVRDRTVNAQTLKAHLAELRREGVEFPEDVGVHVFRTTKVL